MKGAASHVIHAVHVQSVAFLQGLTNNWRVAKSGRVYVYALFVRQLRAKKAVELSIGTRAEEGE